jgi:hypothetical protein
MGMKQDEQDSQDEDGRDRRRIFIINGVMLILVLPRQPFLKGPTEKSRELKADGCEMVSS